MAQNAKGTQPSEKLTIKERVEIETVFRRQALANGYACFPCRGKSGQLKGWPSFVFDEESIEDFAGKQKWISTALQVGMGGLVMLDFDIDDAEALAAIEDAIPEALWDKLKACPVRRGSGVKEAWLARLDEGETAPHYRSSSQKWSKGDGESHFLEVFCKSPKLCVGHGAHTVTSNGRVPVSYYWVDDRGPHNVPLADLPAITDAEIVLLCRVVNEVLDGMGWECVSTGVRQESQGVVYDLELGTVFNTRDHGAVGLIELEALCRASDESIRLSASFMDPSSVNTTRCMASIWGGDGRLYIFETSDYVMHRPAELDLRRKAAGLGERLVARKMLKPVEQVLEDRRKQREARSADVSTLNEEGVEAVGDDALGETVDKEKYDADWRPLESDEIVGSLLNRYCWWPAGTGYVLDMAGGAEDAMTLGSFRTTLLPFCWEEPVKAGSNKTEKVNPVDKWIEHGDRHLVSGYRFLPHHSEYLVEIDGRMYVNTWHGFDHVADRQAHDEGAWRGFMDFMDHLIPDEKDRGWFLMWLAAKVQKPWLPNCGVIMVAERQGTGRGTLFDILKPVFGGRYVQNVNSSQLLGSGGQGQYTDWLASSVLVTCDEVLAGDDSGGSMAWKRREAYERIKTLVDPRPREMAIIQKGLPNYKTQVFASFLMATNNPNALPLAEDDRRIAVILNGAPLIGNESVLHGLEQWRGDVGFSAGFGGAVWRGLNEMEVDWRAVREAPKSTQGRLEMLSANESDLEDILEHVLAEIPSDFMLNSHLRDRMRLALDSVGMLAEVKNWWVRTQDILGKVNRFGWRRMSTRQNLPFKDGKRMRYTVYYRECEGANARWQDANEAGRVALIGAAGDMNAKASEVARRMKERGLTVLRNED